MYTEPTVEKCLDCNGEGRHYDICPYCGEDTVREHHDAGTYCMECGSLEGCFEEEYPACETCGGKGYLTEQEIIEQDFNRRCNRADERNKSEKENQI